MFSRKDRFLHHEPNKIWFVFFDFSTIFKEFSKLLQDTLKQLYSRVPGILHREPWKESNRCNVVLAGKEELAGGGSLPESAGEQA
jgi:hypothetical protein